MLGWFWLGCGKDVSDSEPVGDVADTDTDTDTDTDADTDSDADADTDSDADTDTDTDLTYDTGVTVTGAVSSASCSLDPTNALRVRCEAELSLALDATFTLTQGARTRTATVSATTTPSAALWGFAPDQVVDWTLEVAGGGASGQLATGSLPDGVGKMQVTVSGSPAQVEAFAAPYACAGLSGLMVVDAGGEVLWYEQRDIQGIGTLGGISGFDWTGDRVLMSFDGVQLLEMRPDGEVLFDRAGLDRPVHHDLAGGSPHRFVLNAALHDNTVVDGFYVVDDAGDVVAEWDLADHVPVGIGSIGAFWFAQFPGAGDWSHANSVERDGDRHVLISLKHLNTILRVVSDPLDPDFGEIEWMFGGSSGRLDQDLAWTDAGDFLDQHHVARLSDGGLSVFDNVSADRSRAVLLDVDEVAGTVSEDTSWDLSSRCPVQGSVYELPGGHFLSMCADDGAVWELERGNPTPVAKIDLLCKVASGGAGHLARAQPVTLP